MGAAAGWATVGLFDGHSAHLRIRAVSGLPGSRHRSSLPWRPVRPLESPSRIARIRLNCEQLYTDTRTFATDFLGLIFSGLPNYQATSATTFSPVAIARATLPFLVIQSAML